MTTSRYISQDDDYIVIKDTGTHQETNTLLGYYCSHGKLILPIITPLLALVRITMGALRLSLRLYL
jgi:hypothetical protein